MIQPCLYRKLISSVNNTYLLCIFKCFIVIKIFHSIKQLYFDFQSLLLVTCHDLSNILFHELVMIISLGI